MEVFWYWAWHSSLPTMDASSMTRPGSSKSAAEGPKYHGHSAPSDFLLTAAIQSTTLSIPALKSHCDYLWLQVHDLVGKPKAVLKPTCQILPCFPNNSFTSFTLNILRRQAWPRIDGVMHKDFHHLAASSGANMNPISSIPTLWWWMTI